MRANSDIFFGELRSFLTRGTLSQYPEWVNAHKEALPPLEEYYHKHVPYLKTCAGWGENEGLSTPPEFREIDFYLAPWYISLDLKYLWQWSLLFDSPYLTRSLAHCRHIRLYDAPWTFYERRTLKSGVDRLKALNRPLNTSCDAQSLRHLMSLGRKHSQHLIITDLHLKHTHDLIAVEDYSRLSWEGLQRVYVGSNYDLLARRLIPQLQAVGILGVGSPRTLPELVLKCHSFDQAKRLLSELEASLERAQLDVFFERLSLHFNFSRGKAKKCLKQTFDYVKGDRDFFSRCQVTISTLKSQF